ncbi:DegT/DnrJ/EryC1/StrS family aminotransferase [Alteromonas oceanisediminis]|uniref:DegT/DnrJ/EryC1/StrS family aminotransferase n=1 Tax=Alteromonas oceanisediminis TaxID=2836180 RepID=UPI001BDA3506|nr:DegT/DnrJ/EryC1/StrS family aminotransferase [Alteromonas oceanisediminis]MBT0584940.1 DegT/DnrJ/EryC1/StrS family aminotransferase [Alteromonas oceanisediminis]
MQTKIDIAVPHIGDAEWQATKECFDSGWLTTGPKVSEFERRFAEYHQVNRAIATTSCTTGLHLMLEGLGIGEGDEVIIPAFTWVATANVVMHCGATPVFADVDPRTCNIDAAQVALKITPKTKAVIVVHLFGLCAEMNAIKNVVPKSVAILEDAACASGASYHGVYAGGLGDAAAFSFHPRKVLTTGEGGMVTTNDIELADKMMCLRNHGASMSEEQRHLGPKPYILPEFARIGFNYRMTDFQGAIGCVQISKLSDLIEQRYEIAKLYKQELGSVSGLQLPVFPLHEGHSWQAFVVTLDPKVVSIARNELMEKLQERGISTRPGTHAVHMLTAYRERFGLKPENFPNAAMLNDQSLAIPLHNLMTLDDAKYIASEIKRLLQ